jgi:hypothetical protein
MPSRARTRESEIQKTHHPWNNHVGAKSYIAIVWSGKYICEGADEIGEVTSTGQLQLQFIHIKRWGAVGLHRHEQMEN